MARKSSSKKRLLDEFLQARQPASITEADWRELSALLAPISEGYLRQLLHATGLPVAQPFGGVRLGTIEEMEASLLEMEREYASAVERGDATRAAECRRAVIAAKDRARLISRDKRVNPEKRRQKEEMVEWMLVWLENPAIFETWAGLRKQATRPL